MADSIGQVSDVMFVLMAGLGANYLFDLFPNQADRRISMSKPLRHGLAILFLLVTITLMQPGMSFALSLGLTILGYIWFLALLELQPWQLVMVIALLGGTFYCMRLRSVLDPNSPHARTLKIAEACFTLTAGVITVVGMAFDPFSRNSLRDKSPSSRRQVIVPCTRRPCDELYPMSLHHGKNCRTRIEC